jgi:pimeloyl-ACP methyl ester carboxylesterase
VNSERRVVEGPFAGVKIVIDVTGSGDVPLIWLHSEWGTYGDPPLSERVLASAKVITINHPGWGVSEGIETILSLTDLATAYWWALDQLDFVTPVVIAGHGIGATIAAEMIAQQPQRTMGAVFVTPFGFFREDFPGVDIFALLPKDVMVHMYADPDGAVASAHWPPAADGYERGMQAIRRVSVLGAASRFLFPIPDTGVKRRLYRLRSTPIRLMFGAQDGVVPPELSDLWLAALPDAECTIVQGAGHMLPYEVPDVLSDAVADALATWSPSFA